ncbi:hypothetical protein VNO78_27491 [Psophocarpus tetragonolobus]|uniref:Disease resistance R13L4/SHOC-2-like LRR domain-containing protein n=1 Tax=Psophocarpus tetragonolobus TaxID=3891 RepID=A0AAN9XCB5_PSOTE
MKNLGMLHLGRGLPQRSLKHHIEVKIEEFLKELRHLKYLWYLSLRGISTIFELPPTILQLKRLEVLDLKACHTIETGIEKLPHLKVLTGFVIGNSRNTPCRISEIANLKNLERLSIHIGREAVIQEGEFESLKKLSKLEHLKISWGVFDKKYNEIQIILPSSLKNLHLEGFPEQ